VASLQIPIVDFWTTLHAKDNPESYYQGHYTPQGYIMLVNDIITYLKSKNYPPPTEFANEPLEHCNEHYIEQEPHPREEYDKCFDTPWTKAEECVVTVHPHAKEDKVEYKNRDDEHCKHHEHERGNLEREVKFGAHQNLLSFDFLKNPVAHILLRYVVRIHTGGRGDDTFF
jgi:hypothetical protein